MSTSGQLPDRVAPYRREYAAHLADQVRTGALSRRQLLVRGSVAGLSVGFLGSLLAACGSSAGGGGASGAGSTGGAVPSGAAGPTGKPVKGGVLKLASGTPEADPDPVTMYTGEEINVVQQAAEYLAWVENDGTLTPVLAESWASAADAKTWTFQLKKGVVFTNGAPLTSADVVATFNRLVDPASSSGALSNFQSTLGQGGISAQGPYTVVFELERAYADFPYLVASTNYNAVILPASYRGDWIKSPVGTGPFVLTGYTADQKAVFTRNTAYHQAGLPYLDGLEIDFYDTPAAATTALLAGEVDAVANVDYIGNQPLFGNPSVQILATPSGGTDGTQMRVDLSPFSSKQVRQALAYAIDRPALIEGLTHGYASLGNDHVFSPAFAQHPAVPQRAQNVAKAKQLLAQAGHPNGFAATLTTQTDFSAQAQLVQQYAKGIGIDITLKVETSDAYYGSGGNQPWLVVPLGVTDWASRGTASQFLDVAFVSGAPWNVSHWSETSFTGLVRQFEATTDESSRASLAQQIATIQNDETPMIIAHWIQSLIAASTKVGGLRANSSQFIPLTNAWLAG
jgi:peptide/nickel transport system substrate-binding protein